MSRRTILRDFMLANPLYAGGSVEFFTADANGDKTTTQATLYNNESGTGTSDQLTNPQTLDSEGKFLQDVYFEDRMIGVVSGLTVPDHETGVIHTAGSYRGAWATATVYYPGDTVLAGAAADSTNDIYIIDGLHTSGTFATDVSNGELSQMIDISLLVGLNDVPVITGSDAGKLIQVNATPDAYELVDTVTGVLKYTGALTFQTTVNHAAASGTDTYTITLGLTALVTGMKVSGYFANKNATTTPTLNPDTLGADTIVNIAGGALLYGEINGYHTFQYDGTNWRLLNPYRSAFRGALVYRTATHATGIIAWDNESYDTDTIHDNATNNSRLTVPTGATKVRLSFSIEQATIDTVITVSVYKNGVSVLGGGVYQGANIGSPGGKNIITVTGAIITVSASDYLEVNISGDTLAASATDNWFAMEIIE